MIGKQVARDWEGSPANSIASQDSLANVETLLWKHRVREQDLEAQAEKMSALEAATRSLLQGGHPEAQVPLSRCQAMLLRYLWPWLKGLWLVG